MERDGSNNRNRVRIRLETAWLRGIPQEWKVLIKVTFLTVDLEFLQWYGLRTMGIIGLGMNTCWLPLVPPPEWAS